MIIRKGTEDDIEFLVKLRIDQLIDEGYSLPNESIEDIFTAMRAYFHENIGTGQYISWIAVDEGRIVATSGLCFYSLPPSFSNHTGKIAYLTGMYTLPAYRKRGLATKLIQKVIETAREMGYTVVRLHASEMGKPLYKKIGFKEMSNDMVLKL